MYPAPGMPPASTGELAHARSALCRLGMAALALMLAACTPAADTSVSSDPNSGVVAGNSGDGAQPAEPPMPDPDVCGASRVARFRGQMLDSALKAEIARRSGAKTIRWLKPDTPVTEDFSTSRLNVLTDASGRITEIKCG